MNRIAVILVLVLFILLAFTPYLIARTNTTYRGVFLIGSTALAVLLIPSIYYRWDAGQTIMVMAWLVLLAGAVVIRFIK